MSLIRTLKNNRRTSIPALCKGELQCPDHLKPSEEMAKDLSSALLCELCCEARALAQHRGRRTLSTQERAEATEMGHEETQRRLSHSADSKPGKVTHPVVQQEVPNHQWQLCIAQRAQETQRLKEAGG